MRILGNSLIIFFIFALILVVEAKNHHKAAVIKVDHHEERKEHHKEHMKQRKEHHKEHKEKRKEHHKEHHKKHHHHKNKAVHHAHKHKHVHHKGIHHATPPTVKPMPPPLIHSTTPAALYSPPFVGIDNGQIPHDDQVALILDYLAKIESTIDVFLRLQNAYPDGSKEQGQLIRNVYPPLRVLLEAQHNHEFSIKK